MSDVKRYYPTATYGRGHMVVEKCGDFVRYSDYAALQAKYEECLECNEEFAVSTKYDKAEIARLTEQLVTARRDAWEEALDAAFAYMANQYGISALSNPIDRAQITTTLLGYEEYKL